MKRHLIGFIAILIFSVIISTPLLKPGLFSMHDDQHVARLYLFDKALKGGQFPVRWVDGLGFGFGYPLFNFYPPLIYALGEIFVLINIGFIDSIKIVIFTSILLSGIAMYTLVKDLWGKWPAVIASIFYLMVPYRALDIYVRGALAESFSFIWLPLIFWSFYKLANTSSRNFVFLPSIFLALLMVTHNLIFLPLMTLLPLFILFLAPRTENPRIFIMRSIMSVAYGFFLSAFFWLPSLAEKKFTVVDQILLTNLANYKIHFVYPHQLWNWTWGFGGSGEGLTDGISFKIGKLHVAMSTLAFVVSTLFITRTQSTARTSKLKLAHKAMKTDYYQIIVFFVLFIFASFMTTYSSKFIWDFLQPLAYLQFPWRYLTFSAVFASILVGAFVYLLKLTILKITVGLSLIILLLIPNLKLFQPQFYRTNLTDEEATSDEIINWDVSRTSFEYIPNGVPLYAGDRGVKILDLKKSEIPNKKIEKLSGEVNAKILHEKPNEMLAELEAKGDSQLQINTFNFPGWRVYLDGVEVKIDDDNKLKLINVSIPSGNHQIIVKLSNTPIRTIANLISLTSIILLLIFLTLSKWPIRIKI